MKTKTRFVRFAITGLLPIAATAALGGLAAAEVNQPQEIIDRPRTNPAGQVDIGVDIVLDPNLEADDGELTSFMQLSAGFGIDSRFEARLNYLFALKEFDAEGALNPEIAYGIVNSGNLQLAAEADFFYDLQGELGLLHLGAEVQFKVNDKVAIYSPGQQLVITVLTPDAPEGVEAAKPVFFQIPLGIGIQATPSVFASIETTVAVIEISDSETEFIFADFVPLKLGAYFSPTNTFDVGAFIRWGDLSDDAEALDFLLSARLYL